MSTTDLAEANHGQASQDAKSRCEAIYRTRGIICVAEATARYRRDSQAHAYECMHTNALDDQGPSELRAHFSPESRRDNVLSAAFKRVSVTGRKQEEDVTRSRFAFMEDKAEFESQGVRQKPVLYESQILCPNFLDAATFTSDVTSPPTQAAHRSYSSVFLNAS